MDDTKTPRVAYAALAATMRRLDADKRIMLAQCQKIMYDLHNEDADMALAETTREMKGRHDG